MLRLLFTCALLSSSVAAAADYAMEGPRTVSTAAVEIRAAISPDGTRIVWGSPDREGGPGGWDLWQARRLGEAWIDPQPLALDTAAKEFDPLFSADGRWLYFFSDRPGGRGGDDLYRAAVVPDGYGAVENLGDGVNSAGNEWAPTPSADGRALLFASDGWGGAGGHDLFVARLDGERFVEPRAVPGINTAADEFDGAWNADGSTLVFARSDDVDAQPITLWTAACDGHGYRDAVPLALPFAPTAGYALGPTIDPTRPRELLVSSSATSPSAGKLDIYRMRVPAGDGVAGCIAPGAQAAAPRRALAITVDDLPWSQSQRVDDATIAAGLGRIAAQLHAAHVPAVGFVNEDKLYVDATPRPLRVQALDTWLQSGLELGNHTYGHVDLHAAGAHDYVEAIRRGEAISRPLSEQRRMPYRYFRHPFLRAGRDDNSRGAVADHLAANGYTVAPVTIDNSDWIYARAYDVAIAQGDGATAARIARDFVDHIDAKAAYYEQQSIGLFGREITQVLLLHANALLADTLPPLLERLRARGYAFVTVGHALRDPAYASADGYRGAYGPSWLHRWAMAAGKPDAFFAGEPRTPAYVMQLAGVEAE